MSKLNFDQIFDQIEALLDADTICNLANVSAALYQHSQPLCNWIGWYILRGEEMVLGPFQGKPACVRITRNRGVIGSVMRSLKPALVPDVHEFPGHIACDPESRSEIVVPVFVSGHLVAVLDLDSPKVGTFSNKDVQDLERLVQLVVDRGWEIGGV